MFGPLVIFAAVATASAIKYEAVLKEGVKGVAIQHHETVGIPHRQCSGLIKSELDYPCLPGSYIAVLQVTISNEDAIPKVTFNDGLATASIYRSGSCSGEALVEIGWTCLPFYGPRPNKNGGHTHDFHEGISQRMCDGGGCKMVKSAVAHGGLSQRFCGGAGCRKPRSIIPVPNTENKEKSESQDKTHNAPANSGSQRSSVHASDSQEVRSPVPNIKNKGKRHIRDYFRNVPQRTCDGSTCGNRRVVNSYKSGSRDETQDVPSVRICDGSNCRRAQSKNEVKSSSHESQEVLSERICDGENCGERRRRHDVPSHRICDGSGCKRIHNGWERRSHEPHSVARRICSGSGCRQLHQHVRYRNHDDLSERICDGSGCRSVPSPVLNVRSPEESDETEDVIVHRICNSSSCKRLIRHVMPIPSIENVEVPE